MNKQQECCSLINKAKDKKDNKTLIALRRAFKQAPQSNLSPRGIDLIGELCFKAKNFKYLVLKKNLRIKGEPKEITEAPKDNLP